jgi:RNA polymerase sigma-70 factor, ECF subfamily
VPLRPELHACCTRLTGNVWDGEDLVQEALARVFAQLGKLDREPTQPRAYLIRTATHLWIDRMRRAERERDLLSLSAAAEPEPVEPPTAPEVREAADRLLRTLQPRERAALVLRDVFGFELEEIATMLSTTTGAVKSALARGRRRADERLPSAGYAAPPRSLVEQFAEALQSQDLETLRRLCSSQLTVELVGGAELRSFGEIETFFAHAHFVMPELGFGEHPRWQVVEYRGEAVVMGFRTLNGIEGLNEIHRVEVVDGLISRVRCYCWCPDTLRAVAGDLGVRAIERPGNPYRSP